MLRFIRCTLILGLLIGTLMSGARAAEPPSPSQLEQEIAALRAEIQALRAQTGPDAQRLNEIERQLQVLAQEIETLKLGEASSATGSAGVKADVSSQGLGPAAS